MITTTRRVSLSLQESRKSREFGNPGVNAHAYGANTAAQPQATSAHTPATLQANIEAASRQRSAPTAPAALPAAASACTADRPAVSVVNNKHDCNRLTGRRPNPSGWWRHSGVTCGMRLRCPGTHRSENGSVTYRKVPVHVVVKQQLFCTDCCNVFCAACKAGHDAAACQIAARGHLTEQQLMEAVSGSMILISNLAVFMHDSRCSALIGIIK